MKTLLKKNPSKKEKIQQVLFGLVELYIKTGKPIGSQTLQAQGFDHLSPATIRNYFAKLEDEGFLHQQHASGGRVPTDLAFRLYAQSVKDIKAESVNNFFIKEKSTKEVKSLLHRVTEEISESLELSAIASFPIFDQDFIQKIRCIDVDESTLVCLLVTDYGQIRTETFYNNYPVTAELLKKAETYFLWRIGKEQKPEFAEEKDFIFARKLYTEIMLRHALVFGNSLKNSIHKTGLSFLMKYPELNNTNSLSTSLLFFEDEETIAGLLKKAMIEKKLSFWIGKDLFPHIKKQENFSFIAIPYFINHSPAGAIALFGPERMDYKKVFQTLKGYADKLSERLTKNIYKHKIPFRASLEEERIGSACSILLEDKSQLDL